MTLTAAPASDEILSRCLDPERHVREFAAVAEFHRRAGIPGIGPDWFHHVGRAAWQRRNPRVYRVYLRQNRIAGCFAVAPLRETCVEALLTGRRSLWWEVTADDILEPAEHDRARFFDCTLLMEAYTFLDEEVEERMRWDLLEDLRRTNLRRVIAHSSDARSELECERSGMRPVLDGERLPNGFRRRLWAATAEDFPRERGVSFAMQPFLWHVFERSRAHFAPPTDGLRLTERQQQVAYLHYCERQPVAGVAAALGCKPETVRTHLRNIRERAKDLLPELMPVLVEGPEKKVFRGVALIASYLREHPGEVAAAGTLLAE